jgi:N-carbamoyl-L-amino-acid hydrolase
MIAFAPEDHALAAMLFERLRAGSANPPGITRASYGEGEQMAHDLARATALQLQLEVITDFAGNLYMTLPGRDRSAPAVMMGSHMDSVPHGGNYDGAAGVVAGLVALARLRRLGRTPQCDLTVMAIRAEELSWFPAHYIGSRAAFGRLPAEALEAVRFDTGRKLAAHMRAATPCSRRSSSPTGWRNFGWRASAAAPTWCAPWASSTPTPRSTP